MQRLLNPSEVEELLHKELHACLRTVQELAAGDPATLEDGIAKLRHLRGAVFESINQIQHEGLILKAARWLQKEHGYGPNAEWEWNPRQTGTVNEPDLRVKIGTGIEVSAEATASEKPTGVLDTRMSQTLAKLNVMPGKKYYFVRTDMMAWRAKTKVQKAGFDIAVVLPHESSIPTLQLHPDPQGRLRIPPLEDQTRPRRIISGPGNERMEALPLFERLLKRGDNWHSMPGLKNEYCGREVWNNLHIVQPTADRYGCLPLWFPEEDSQGRKLSQAAQVDRFLCFLGQIIALPEDHRKLDPRTLVMGLFELFDSNQNGAFEDWDEGRRWETEAHAPKGITNDSV